MDLLKRRQQQLEANRHRYTPERFMVLLDKLNQDRAAYYQNRNKPIEAWINARS